MNSNSSKKIMVVGDVILDEYIVGEDYHISDEAPVPILKVDEFVPKLGGAANVANNIKSMGKDALLYGAIGYTGHGYSAKRFIDLMEKNNLSTCGIVQGSIKTTTKSRVIIKNQQVVRFDYEDSFLPEVLKKDLLNRLVNTDFDCVDFIVVSDYKKGVISPEVMDILKNSQVKIIIDPKPSNVNIYDNVFCITPNLKEFNELTGKNFHKNDVDKMYDDIKKFRDRLNIEYVVVKVGDVGAIYCDKSCCKLINGYQVEVSNPIGAGDTFISALSVSLSNGENVCKSVDIANFAASVAVSKKYTGVCTIKELNYFKDKERYE